MFRLKKSFKSGKLFALALVLSSATAATAWTYNFALRDSGYITIQFGPAIIWSCKSMQLIDFACGSTPERITVRSGDRNFDEVKRWVANKFEDRLNLSPEQPHTAVGKGKFLALYSTETPPSEDTLPDGRLLFFERRIQQDSFRKSFLLTIPLSPAVFGVSRPQFNAEYNELRSLMKNGT